MRSWKASKKWFVIFSMVTLLSTFFSGTAYMEGNYATSPVTGAEGEIVQALAMNAGGATFVLFLGADGHVYANGDNTKGVYGNGQMTPAVGAQFMRVNKASSGPGGMAPLSDIDRLYATQGGIVFAWDKDSQTLYSWGDNAFFRGGVSSDLNTVIPVAKEVDFLGAPIEFAGDTPQSIHVTGGTTFVIDRDGKVWSWGQAALANVNTPDFRLGREVDINDTNEMVFTSAAYASKVPGIVAYPAAPDEKAVAVAGGGNTTSYILTDKGNVFAFGGTTISPTDRRFKAIPHPTPGRKFMKISATSGGAAILLDDIGQVYTMNLTDTTDAQSVAVKPNAIYSPTAGNPTAAASTFTKVSVGGAKNQATFFATTDQGQVYVWGNNFSGIAGTGATGVISKAVLNSNFHPGDDIGVMTSTGVMLRAGKLFTWGTNSAYQLANGTTNGVASSTPLQVLPEYLTGDGTVPPEDKPPTPAPPLPNPLGADFMINNNRVLVGNFAGWGSQYNQALYADITQHEYGTTPQNVGDLENKVIELGSQHVRIFYDPDYNDLRNYDNRDLAKGTTVTDQDAQSFIKTVELAQRSGSTINITYWHPLSTSDDSQMKTFADMVKKLIVDKGYTGVQQLTIMNEPNNDGFNLDRYNQLYRSLDHYLKDWGIRDRVKLVGGDLVNNNQQSWLEYMAYNMADVLDGFSVHIYWDYWDKGYALNRLTSVRNIMDNMYSKNKPIYITEFGVRGYRVNGKTDPRFGNPLYDDPGASTELPIPGVTVATSEMPLAAFEHAWFNMQSANLGYVAAVRWDAYQAKYDSGWQNFSMIGKGMDGYPLRPGYSQLKLMTALTERGWKVVGAEPKASTGSKVASSFLGPNGEQTLFALNNTSATTSISMAGLTPGTSYRIYNWNKSGDSAITYEGTAQADANGMIAVIINKESYAAITTVVPAANLSGQDNEATALDRGALAIGYSAGDSAASVIRNVALPTAGANGSTVAWSSDAPNVVSAAGVVTRPAASGSDAVVTLTATVTKGAAAETKSFVLNVPKLEAPPVTTLQVNGTIGTVGWYVSDVTVALTATDDKSGVASTEYALTVLQSVYGQASTNGFVAYTGPISLSDGRYQLQYRSTDVAGNVEAARTADIRVDQTAPLGTLIANGIPLTNGASVLDSQILTLAIQASDAVSGVASQTIAVDGVPYTPGLSTSVINWAGMLGTHVIQLVVTDQAGNVRTTNISVNITTSTAAIQQLIARFLASGDLSDTLEKKISNKFEQALDQWGKGHRDQAVKHMQDALKEIGKAKAAEISPYAEQVLRTDINAILDAWSTN